MSITLNKTIYLRATPAKVWAFLTEPDKLAQWFHKPNISLCEGQNYEKFGAESGDKLVWGEVRIMTPFSQLEYTFNIAPLGGVETTVRWDLSEVEGGTRLELTHSGLPKGGEAFGLVLALDDGWEKHFGQLRSAATA